MLSDVTQITIRNTQGILVYLATFQWYSGVINKDCGAAIVQAERRAPANFTSDNVPSGQACCSFGNIVSMLNHYYVLMLVDGDGDRVVFFYFDSQRQFRLLDGDKIIALCAAYINDLLRMYVAVACTYANSMISVGLAGQVTIGVVQTAYANGASTGKYAIKC